jgi:HK97 family phage portal protein
VSLLARATAPRAMKAIDQEASALTSYQSGYIPIESLQRWTGLGVTAETALNYITIYQCVRILADTFASLPLIVYRRLPSGGKERAEDHPLYRTLHDQPNPSMTSFVWRELLMTHLATWGNAYNEIRRDGAGDIELWPIRPDRIEVKWGTGGRKVYTYISPRGERTEMREGSVFHVQGISLDGLVGISPIDAMRRAIRLARTAEQFGQSFFDNGARPATVLKHPKTLTDGAIERLGAQMDTLRGSGNAGKTVVLEEGLDFGEVGIPPEDAQFMETRLFQKRELASGYGIPGGMVGDPEREEDEDQESRKFIKRAMVPYFERFEQEVSRQLVESGDDVFAEILADGYLRGDPKARADAYAVMWEHGTLNGDDWRAKENMDPLPDELGKVYYRPANWVPLGQPEDPAPAVGGEASEATQFGGPRQGEAGDDSPAQVVPQLTRVKMAQFDCPDCGKLINRLAAPGTVGYCKSCKAERVFEEDLRDPLVDLPERIAAAIPKAEPPIVHFHEGAFRTEVHLPATQLEPRIELPSTPPPAAPVVNVAPERSAVRKTVERDSAGRITSILEVPLDGE